MAGMWRIITNRNNDVTFVNGAPIGRGQLHQD